MSEQRTLLAIETSGRSLGVALRRESTILFEENVSAGSIHGRALAPLTDKALKTHGLKAAQLSAIVVSLGPGSWTGLRIGLSFAKALAWGAGVPLIGVSSFEAMARHAGTITPLSARLTLRDARSEGYFCALFGETSGSPERFMDDAVMKPAECLALADKVLQSRQGLVLSICGDRVCLDGVAEHAGARGWKLLHECEHVPAWAVAECGWQRFERGEMLQTPADIHKLAPLYLRASDPELKLIRK